VNNESSEIIRIFNSAFNDLVPKDKAALDFYPVEHRAEIDELNKWVYDDINSESHRSIHNALTNVRQDGVYKSGFATKQEAYETAVHKVFEGLDKVEKILTGKDYLVGGKLTEADIRLFVTIVSEWGFTFTASTF
jgi:putative glutathione S-transferase